MTQTDWEPVIQLRHEFAIVSEKNETVASATVERMNGVHWLTNVWTHHEYRRRGYAARVLESVIMHFGVDDLWLKVHPYTDRPRDEHQLTAFYSRFGFVPADAPGIMRRPGDNHKKTPVITVDSRQVANAVIEQIDRRLRGRR